MGARPQMRTKPVPMGCPEKLLKTLLEHDVPFLENLRKVVPSFDGLSILRLEQLRMSALSHHITSEAVPCKDSLQEFSFSF